MLIIDDRIIRQNNYLTSFKIEEYKDVVVNCVGDSFTKLKESFKDKDKISEFLSPFDVVAIHRSAFDEATRESIVKFLEISSKKLVLFSGGISSSSLVGNVLNINSKDFYSENLKLFCDMLKGPTYHLSVLQFGENWQLSLILGFREQLINAYNSYKESSNVTFRLNELTFFDSILSCINITLSPTQVLEKDDYESLLVRLNQEISSFLN